MRTLIVLCAGSRQLNEKPIILNRHPDGKLLAEKAIEGIYPESYDRIIFTIRKSMQDNFATGDKVLEVLSTKYPVEIVTLDKETNGPAGTVYETIKKADVEGEFAARDSLNTIQLLENRSGNFIGGLELTKYNQDIFHIRSKSFITINEQNQVLDVVEKKFRSDIISVGIYGFRKSDDFIEAYTKLNDRNYPIDKIYVSNIISYLIGYKQRVFHFAETVTHEDWGRNETWHALQKKYGICIVNIDKFNLDTEETFVNQIAALLIKKNIPTQSFIFCTAKNDINGAELKEELNTKGIRCLDVVVDCPITEEISIINSSDELMSALMEVY